MTRIILLLFLVGYSYAWGQTVTVTGVVNHPGKHGPVPLAFAEVHAGSAIHVLTDTSGRFAFDAEPGDLKLVIELTGYQRYERTLHLQAGQPMHLSISLNRDVEELEPMTVSGNMREVRRSESPVTIEVYRSSFFEANKSASVFESLQNVNGVRPQINCNVCNTGDIHINGLEGPYTMVLIDGMPIVSGLGTVYGLTGIPQSLIEQVEIVKGPASTLYGSEAVGGLINIITRSASTAPKQMVDVSISSWGELNADLGFSRSVGEKWHTITGVNYFNYNNPIDRNNDGFTDVTLQHRISAFNKWTYTRNDKDVLKLAGRYVYEDRWGGQMNWNPTFRGGDSVYGESIYTSRWELYGTYKLPVKEDLAIQVSMNDHRQNSVYGNTLFLADQRIVFGQLIWNKSWSLRHHLLTGLTYRYTYYDDNTPATEERMGQGRSIIHLPGVFVQDELRLSSKWTALSGLRYDYNSIHGNIITPRLNLKWQTPDHKQTIRISYGSGYRVANVFTEDHAALTGARTVVFADALKPERSQNVNINWMGRYYPGEKHRVVVDVSGFYTHFSNRIVPDYESDPTEIRYDNLNGYALSKGVSANLDFISAGGLRLRTGATLMDVTIHDNGESYRQLLTEQFTGVWRLGYRLKRSGIELDYTGNVYSPMRLPLLGERDERPEYSPWYSIQNVQAAKEFGHWKFYAVVKNILNFTPPANSIARPFDPFDKNVVFDTNGQPVATADNPQALTFDPSYVFAPNQGIRLMLGFRYLIE